MPIPAHLDITNLRALFPADFTPAEAAKAQTIFLKRLSLRAHQFYGGKMITVPKVGMYGPGWFGVWYTPGVSAVSTAIRDDNLRSFDLSNRSNLVAVVSDSTRVLGDGDCTPCGGLGVMEGKAFLMYYLGGVDAVALCVNSHSDPKAYHDGFHFDPRHRHHHLARKIVDFVRMAAPSFGAVNLEDISQPNCFQVLDELQDCGIPVWHDDAQGTACVTLAALINALGLAGKTWARARGVFLGSGAGNASVIRLLLAHGLDPAHVVAFDSKGALHAGRDDIRDDPHFYRKWEICRATNPERVEDPVQACRGADFLCCLSAPGPGRVPKDWIGSMADKAIVFACANPVPEIYPYEAKEAGAYIVATGRSDFPNQVNNSLCFPALLKGCLLVHASAVTDRMAIAAALALARAQKARGLDPEHILPSMDDPEIYPREAAEVAAQAAADGVARRSMPPDEVFRRTARDIRTNRDIVQLLMESGHIPPPPRDMMDKVLAETLAEVRGALAGAGR